MVVSGVLTCAVPFSAALAGWGLRHAPRVGAALAALTLGATAWMLIGLRLGDGGLQPVTGPVPWGGLQKILPVFGEPIERGEAILLAVVGVALAGLAAREWRAWHATRDTVISR
jgi:hypothetical protein